MKWFDLTMFPRLKIVFILICLCILWMWFNFLRINFGASNTVADKGPTLVRTPPMGWNSWNYFRCEGLNENVVKKVADALVENALAKAGYVYVNLDDCWQVDRNASGHIQEDRTKFPSGMASLGNYIHKKGLKFGIYTDVGTLTCEKRPGSFNHAEQDVASYCEWGVDYLKNDDCWYYPGVNAVQHYDAFRKALQSASRPIVHSIKSTVPLSLSPKYGHIRRVGSDIYEEWGSVIALIDRAVKQKLWQTSRPGFWHDLDMLEVGNGEMTEDENVCHMILWCAFKAPLLLGNDIRSMSQQTLSLLTHDELLAINQDALGQSVKLVWWESAKGGLAAERTVAQACDAKSTKQQWAYQQKIGRLESVSHSKCLGVKSAKDLLAVLKTCDEKDPLQHWYINTTSGQISLTGLSDKCLTSTTSSGIACRVRGCSERQNIPYYRGPNQGWFYYNDAFVSVRAGTSAGSLATPFTLSNMGSKCVSVGDQPELQVFSGSLSGGRDVAVLLNRDEIEHSMILRRDHFAERPSTAPVSAWRLRDAYRRTDLGRMDGDTYSITLRAHSAIMIVATPL